MFVCLQKGAKQCCELTKLSYTYCSGEQPSGVSSPHFLEGPTESQTFLSMFTLELLWIMLKSHVDLVSAPPLFF